MNTLLIYPSFPDTFWSFKHALRFVRKRASFPPLGLLTVAAMLPEEWSKRLVDVNVGNLRDDDLAWADVAMISAMNVQRDSAREVIERCRQAGLTIVAGGPLFTAEHDEFEDVDHFVLDEAERSLPPFLADLEAGRAHAVYRASDFPDIQHTPVPMWSLVDMKRYASMSIQFSRGCPYHCDFCNVTALFGRRVRTKTVRQIVDELDGLHARGWNGNIFFVDDNFIGNKKFLKSSLLPALIEWRRRHPTVTFQTEVTINLADDAGLMRMMVESGFDTVFIGIESPEENSLEECSKHQNRKRDLVADVKLIQRSGLEVQGGFIVGFDHDSPSIFQRQIELIQRSGIVTAMVGMLQAPTGTQLYERLKREGRLLGAMSGDTDGTTNIVPAMGLPALRAGYRRIIAEIYSADRYYQRVRTFLAEYRSPSLRLDLDRQQVLPLLRSVLRLGILGQERWHYWRLLAWTYVRHPRLLPLAIRLAIYGYHFRRVSEQYLR